MYTNHKIDQDGHWQQSDTQPILISAPQWPNRTCNAPTQPYRVSKKLSMKADLAIYSHTVDAAGQCMNESLMLGHNLDLVLVTFWSVFVNPVTFVVRTHKYVLNTIGISGEYKVNMTSLL